MSGSETSHHSVEKTEKKRRRAEDVNLTIKILQSEKYLSVKKLLGRGTYGDVFMMYDSARKSHVAVKIITEENMAEIEYQMWPELRHPNIVPVLEVITIGPVRVTCFVMPVQRKSLHDVLYDTRFLGRDDSLEFLKLWLYQTLCALDYLDSRNLCHLDIKVDNVLISHGYSVKLCDFSFLNYQSEGLKRYDLGLPYIYRPPEACHTLGSNISVDGRAYDMWGFGIMVLEIFTHFILATNIEDCTNWIKEVYPTLFGILQEKEFSNLMVSTFPGSNINETQTKLALDFIHSFLMLNPLERSPAVEALDHQFLNRGMYLVSCTDPIWTHEVYSKSVDLPSVKSWMAFVDGQNYEGEDQEEFNDSSDGYSTMSDSEDGSSVSNSMDEFMNNLSQKDQTCSGTTEKEQSNNENFLEVKFFNKNSESSSEFDFSQMGDISAIKKDEKILCLLNSKHYLRDLPNDGRKDNNENLNQEYTISQSDSRITRKKMKKRLNLNKRSNLHRNIKKAKIFHLSSVVYKSPCSYKRLENVLNSTTELEKLHYKKLIKVGSRGRCTFYRVHKKNVVFSSNERKPSSNIFSDHESPKRVSDISDSNETCEVRTDSNIRECSEKLNATESPKDNILENINGKSHLTENSKWATGDTFSTEIGDLIDLSGTNNPSTSCTKVMPSSEVKSTILDDEDSIQGAEILKSANKTLGQLNAINDALQKILICENCKAKRKKIEQDNLEHEPLAEIRPDSLLTDLKDTLKEVNEDHFRDESHVTAKLKVGCHERCDKSNDFSLDIINTQHINLIISSAANQKELQQLENGKNLEQEGNPESCEGISSLNFRSGWKKWMRNRCVQIERAVKCCNYKILK